MEKQRRGGNDLLLRASSTKKEKEEKNERRSERSQPSDLERDLFLPLARSHSLFCSGLLLENVRNSRYTRREGTIRRVLTSDEPREDGGKKGSANKKNERRRRRTNEGPSFDDEQGRKKKKQAAASSRAALPLFFSLSLILSTSPLFSLVPTGNVRPDVLPRKDVRLRAPVLRAGGGLDGRDSVRV